MSNEERQISKIVREKGENLTMIIGPENAGFVLGIYGDPNRARNASPYQTRKALRILGKYNML